MALALWWRTLGWRRYVPLLWPLDLAWWCWHMANLGRGRGRGGEGAP